MKQNRVRATLDEFRKTFLPGHNVDEEEGGDDGEEGSLCNTKFLLMELPWWEEPIKSKKIQGDNSGREQPPVDLNLERSPILPGL